MKSLPLLALTGILALGAAAPARADATRGAILGGIAGAVIGHQSREGVAGAAVGVVAGGLLGHAYDQHRERRSHREVVTYESPRCDTRRVVYVERPRPVVVHRHVSRPQVVVIERPIVVERPVVIERHTVEIGADDCADAYGYTSADYLALLRPSEVQLLRARAYGDSHDSLSTYLSTKEKANLRARAARQTEIGA